MIADCRSARGAELIERLDGAVELDCVQGRCSKVKEVLEDVFRSGDDFLPARCLAPAADRYARRLIHRDPAGRYSVVAMVWGVGQGTALHDHAGEWCVECVYRGRIEVTSYDIQGSPEEPLVQFKREKTVYAGTGEAGALIPPFEYHTIANALTDEPSVTIHVYGHELTWCHIFEPVEGGYRRVRKDLCYTD
ncbi:MAG: cysteine dioxygenase family protein [Armatimonadetes bacterium]|nr:cysteine dioxygenase family protein [Armatimonadota bacterium]